MRLSLAILFFFMSLAAWSQDKIHFTNYYGFRDGLINNFVFCLRQDSKGFLWLGTKEGLNRFDGFQFKEYLSEKNNPNSLSHNKVFDILEYQPGFLLFATGSGLSVLNTKTGRFENEKIKFAPLQARSGSIVSSMFQDREKRIWINHSGEIDVFDKDLQYLFRFTDMDWALSLKGIIIRYESWYMDQQGRLWLPTDDSGLQIIDFDAKNVISKHNNPENLPYLEYTSIRSFLLDEKQNTLWLAPWGEGLIKFDLDAGKIGHAYFNLTERDEYRSINTLTQTAQGTLLFTIGGHCYEMDTMTMQYRQVTLSDGQSENTIQGFPSFIFSSSMIRAGDHQYWIGGYGLIQLDDIKTQDDLVLIPTGKPQRCAEVMIATSGMIYSIYEDGWLIAAHEDRANFTRYRVPIPPPSSLTALCEDHEGQLWIGSSSGVLLFNPATTSFHSPDFLPSALLTSHINVLFSDSEDNIWIGTRDSFHLYCYEPVTGNTRQIPQETIKQFMHGGRNGRISAIAEDHDGSLWMVSIVGGGLLRYERNADRWSSWPSGTRHHEFLVNKGIVSFLPGEDGILFLSTVFGDGLVAYDYQRDSVVQFTREQGLLTDYVQTIHADSTDHLWLTSEYGITQFSTKTGHAVSNIIFESKQLSNESFEAVFDPKKNELIFGARDRYIFIPAKSDSGIWHSPTPVLDRIRVNNEEQFIDLEHVLLDLDHTQKNISIDFTAVHFTNADKLRFAYQLVGADDEWKYVTVNRSAQYAALSPGSYVFKLKVADERGNWGPDHEMMSFTIVPPFWKTAWFILLVTGTATVVTYWIVRRYIRTIRYEAGLKQKIAETEMMALRAQMNPHFIFNCINSIDSLIQDNDKYHATIYLNKFAKLIRSILDSAKQNTVMLANDLDTLRLYIEMEQFRSENKFTSSIKADPGLLEGGYKVPPLIIQPYVENAILHGLRNRPDNDGLLSISLQKLNGQIQYIIEDNGVGRKQTTNGHGNQEVSYGLQMSSDRVRLFNQEENASVEITDLVANGHPAGTRVEVLLKMT